MDERVAMNHQTAERMLPPLFDLSGQVAVVTGGSRGLGLQIAEALGACGAKLLLLSRKVEELEEAAAHLRKYGYDVDHIARDLSDADAPRAVVKEAIQRHGSIEILINAAGTTWGARAEEHSSESWDKVMRLNVDATFRLTQAVAVTAMIPARYGKIVNVASVAGLLGHHPKRMGTIAYSTSKGALIQMTRALAAEWAPLGINVNAIAPGYFPTKMTSKILEQMGDDYIVDTPLGRLGGPEDLKGPAILLSSQAGAFITGQVIVVDGGNSII